MKFSYEVEDLFSDSKCNSPTEEFSHLLNGLIPVLIDDVNKNFGRVVDFSEIERSGWVYETCSMLLSDKDDRIIQFVLKEDENNIAAIHVSLFNFAMNQQTGGNVLYDQFSIPKDLLKGLVSLFSLVESKKQGLSFLPNSDIQLIRSKIEGFANGE